MQNSKAAGIVAEYNPFHNGHQWMASTLRAEGFDTLVCVMSGPFVQRGEAALFSSFVRAQAAIAGGIDLVLRLPTPWAIASAEPFAYGGISVLAALGCLNAVAFGAEAGKIVPLMQAANLLQTEPFAAGLKKQLEKGISFAAARAEAAETFLPGASALLASPNNILGVEYCKALLRLKNEGLAGKSLNSGMPTPLALSRKGANHDGLPQDGIASASWLRGQTGTDLQKLQQFVPKDCFNLYKDCFKEGNIRDDARFGLALLARLRGQQANFFAPYAGHSGEGLAARMTEAAAKACTLQELYSLAKSKRFAHARIRRTALATALQLPTPAHTAPPFIQVMAANTRGLALLKKAKQTAVLPLSTSLAKLAQSGEAASQYAKSEAIAEDFYSLCLHTPQPGGKAYTQPAYIYK